MSETERDRTVHRISWYLNSYVLGYNLDRSRDTARVIFDTYLQPPLTAATERATCAERKLAEWQGRADAAEAALAQVRAEHTQARAKVAADRATLDAVRARLLDGVGFDHSWDCSATIQAPEDCDCWRAALLDTLSTVPQAEAPARCPHVAQPGSRHEDEDCACVEGGA